MRTTTVIIAAALMLLVAGAAFTQTTTIPRYTVIPVTSQQGISSATNQVGDTFQSVCSYNCGGFPSGTVFIGRVTDVVRASRGTPGQIDVDFTRAMLPGGTQVRMDGQLTSLNRNDVTVDANTGTLVQRAEVRNQRNKFLAYGAGAGLLIGALTGGNSLKGALIGAIAGYLYGTTAGRDASYRNVDVPAGTQFGIVLTRDVALRTGRGGTGAGPGPVSGMPRWTVGFYDQQGPFVTNRGVVMVPVGAVMSGIRQSYSYNQVNRSITINTRDDRIIHYVNTNVVYVDNQTVRLSARSRIINSVLYVPSDFISVVTGRNVFWDPGASELLIY